ncbi:MAG TPA: aminomethyltransferase family protein [Pyrinomonadaceae bacterium]
MMIKPTLATEYAAVRDGSAGVIDLSARGRLLISGSEAVMFLNGLITNDMKTLAVNSWMPAVFPNVQGRLLAAVRIIHREDGFLIDTESATLATVLKLLERFTLAGDFHVADLTSETAMLSIQGMNSDEVILKTLGETVINRHGVVIAQLGNGAKVTIIRATHTAEDGFDLFISANESGSLHDSLTRAGAQPVGAEALEVLRVEAGIPRFGLDMDETNVVTETNLDEAVSFTKGCYIGQEIIARIKYRGHVAKKLTGLTFENEVALESGAQIFSADDKEIGRVTSLTFSPRLKRTIALGYVKYDYLEPGTNVSVVYTGEKLPATVAALPFIHGSWYSDLAPSGA